MDNFGIGNIVITSIGKTAGTEIISGTEEVLDTELNVSTEEKVVEGEVKEGESTTETGVEEVTEGDEMIEESRTIDGETVPLEGEVITTEGGEMGIDPIIEDGSMIPGVDEGMPQDGSMIPGTEVVKDPFLASWPSVIGISGAVLLVSVFLGALLAKRKIKKGIELYED